MPKKRNEPEPHLAHVSVRIGPTFLSAWDEIILPWFRTFALEALRAAELVAVVTPFPIGASFLRAKLLEHEIPLLGVKFLTPTLLREFLLADEAATAPLREHLRLLLAVAAERTCSKHSADIEIEAIAKSIARSPDNLLRVFDQVSAAGWNLEEFRPPAVREILEQFLTLVRKCGFKLVHEADRELLAAAPSEPKRLKSLLMIGFTAEHWSLLPLLQAALNSAREATVVLDYPREQTRAADEAWVGTWEQILKPAEPIAEQSERKRPFAGLVRPEPAIEAPERPYFLVGLNTTEQAQAICAAALKFLLEKSCTKLGILFPHGGALPRLVSESLQRCGIPHYDGIGHLMPGDSEEPAWNTWTHLQENHQLEPLLRFLETQPELLGRLSIQHVRDKLRSIYREILLNDINVLREYCARQTDSADLLRIGNILRAIRFLPANATLRQFLVETKKIFAELKWQNRWSTIEQFSKSWSNSLSVEFGRPIYLRWLRETLDSFSVGRAAQANHPYSRIHLLTYAEAEAEEWSHLILAGLNQGEWPPSEGESGFLPDNHIADLNQRATRPGEQGEGHITLLRGKTFLLSSRNERQIALRQFAAAIESVECRLAIIASLLQESAPERIWNPSEVFSQIYFATFNVPLSQEMFSHFREKTAAWLDEQVFPEPAPALKEEVRQTGVAYAARRRGEVPFGEYEFALRAPLDRKITLRATEWNKVVKSPALLWIKIFLGLENEEPDLNQWTVATGTWVHDWLAQLGAAQSDHAFVDFPSDNQIRERLSRAARNFRQRIVELCDAANRPLPDWWESGWSNAFALADFLASKLGEAQGWPRLSSEWNLESQELTVAGNKLRVRGRIDLILSQRVSADSRLDGKTLWIVDYKTGNVKPLNVSGKTPESRAAKLRQKLVRGDAIQLGLYGLAARELGANDVQLSILSLRTDLDKPQLVLDDLAAHTDFWNELYRMQETGIFGVRGLIRSDFGFNPDYPLAVLPIDKEFLDEKWVLTHPAFADDEEERS